MEYFRKAEFTENTNPIQDMYDYYKENNLDHTALLDNSALSNHITIDNKPKSQEVANPLDWAKGYQEYVKKLIKPGTTATEVTPTTSPVSAQTENVKPLSGNKKEYFKEYNAYAESTSKKTGLPKSFILAQIALETGYGKSTPGFNVGGIKASKGWNGKTNSLTTKEEANGKVYTTKGNFRAYNNKQEGIDDYANFLLQNKRYSSLIGEKDPYKAADKVAAAGYATDSGYSPKLKSLIKEFEQMT